MGSPSIKMRASLVLPENPTEPMEATPKQYVDTAIGSRAPIANPTLTGVPRGPTAATGNNTTQLATTEYTVAEIVSRAPGLNGSGATGTWPIAITGQLNSVTNNRGVKPNTSGLHATGHIRPYFAQKGLLDGGTGGGYGDFLMLDTYTDASGGRVNGMFFSKDSSKRVYYYQGAWNADLWDAPREFAFTDTLQTEIDKQVTKGTAFNDAFATATEYYAAGSNFDVNTLTAGRKALVYVSGNPNTPPVTNGATLYYIESVTSYQANNNSLLQRAYSYSASTPVTFIRSFQSANWTKWAQLLGPETESLIYSQASAMLNGAARFGGELDWVLASGAANASIEVEASAMGGYVYRFGDNNGNDSVSIRTSALLPFDPNKLYRVRARYRRVSGTGSVYLGLGGFTADKTLAVSDANATTGAFNVQHYFVSNVTAPMSEWQEVVSYVKGRAAGARTGSGTLSDPYTMARQVAYVCAGGLFNYNNQPGIQELDYLIIEDADHLLGGEIQSPFKMLSLLPNAALELDASRQMVATPKQSGYNLPVGTTAGSVAAGDHTHTQYVPNLQSMGAAARGTVVVPAGGTAYFGNSATGAIKIKLPSTFNNTMLRFRVRLFNYSSARTGIDLIIGGYPYSGGGGTWANTSATISSSAPDLSGLTVRFGADGTSPAIFIGELDTTWLYAQVVITEVQLVALGGASPETYESGWALSLETAGFTAAPNGGIPTIVPGLTATRLSLARTIALTGPLTGTGSFDGSADLSIATSLTLSHANVTGTLPIAKGGTGVTSFTSGRYLRGSGGGIQERTPAEVVGDLGVWGIGPTGPVIPTDYGDLNDMTGFGAVWAGNPAPNRPTGSNIAVLNFGFGNYNQQFAIRNNKFYIRSQENGVWQSWVEVFHTGNQIALGATPAAARAAIGAVTHTNGAAPHLNPNAGDEWTDPASGRTYRYLWDGNSSQWVELGPVGGSNPPGGSSDPATFESVSRNLKSYPTTLHYTGDDLTSVVYSLPSGGSITKTMSYVDERLTTIILSGETPAGVALTKTFTYTDDALSGVVYS